MLFWFEYKTLHVTVVDCGRLMTFSADQHTHTHTHMHIHTHTHTYTDLHAHTHWCQHPPLQHLPSFLFLLVFSIVCFHKSSEYLLSLTHLRKTHNYYSNTFSLSLLMNTIFSPLINYFAFIFSLLVCTFTLITVISPSHHLPSSLMMSHISLCIFSIRSQFHIPTLAKISFQDVIGVLYGVCAHFSLPPSCLLCIGALSAHVWSMVLISGGSTHTTLLNRVESKAFRLINTPPLTMCLAFLSHRRNIYFLPLFSCWFSSELGNCMPPTLPWPRCTRLSTFHPYSVHLSNARVNQYLHSFITLVNSGTLSLCFSTCLWQTFSEEEFQDTSNVNWTSTTCLDFSYCPMYRVWRQAGYFFLLIFVCPYNVKKREEKKPIPLNGVRGVLATMSHR